MPPKGNTKQPKGSGGKSKKKRKAKSPLESGQAEKAGKTSLQEGGVSDINKRQIVNEHDLIMASPMNTMNNMNNMNSMTPNMASPNTPNGQYPPPPTYPQYQNYNSPMMPNQQMFQHPPIADTSKPAWAQELLDELKKSTSKIDKIEKTVDRINLKMIDMETKMKDLETRTIETEKSCTHLSGISDTHQTQLQKTKRDMDNMQAACKTINEQMLSIQQKEEKASEKLLDIESRSMRENLIFYGLQEADNENCEQLVKDLIQTKLHIDPSDMIMDRAHRIGGNRAKKPRPIVVKFHRYSERETVRTKSLDTNIKTELRGSNQGVSVQLPQQYREARKALHGHAQQERNNGKQTKIIGNKLFVDNKPTKKFVNGNIINL